MLDADDYGGIVEPSAKLPSWVAFWKEVGSDRVDFSSPLLWFGISGSAEEVQEKIDRKAKADPLWAEKWAHGVFYPLGTHQGMVIKRWRR